MINYLAKCFIATIFSPAPGDYISFSSNILTFDPGDTSLTINVPTVEDDTFEDNENFNGILSSPSPGRVRLGLDTAEGTILNDDGMNHVSTCDKMMGVFVPHDCFHQFHEWIRIPFLIAHASF